jgi:hypothetical protein
MDSSVKDEIILSPACQAINHAISRLATQSDTHNNPQNCRETFVSNSWVSKPKSTRLIDKSWIFTNFIHPDFHSNPRYSAAEIALHILKNHPLAAVSPGRQSEASDFSPSVCPWYCAREFSFRRAKVGNVQKAGKTNWREFEICALVNVFIGELDDLEILWMIWLEFGCSLWYYDLESNYLDICGLNSSASRRDQSTCSQWHSVTLRFCR